MEGVYKKYLLLGGNLASQTVFFFYIGTGRKRVWYTHQLNPVQHPTHFEEGDDDQQRMPVTGLQTGCTGFYW